MIAPLSAPTLIPAEGPAYNLRINQQLMDLLVDAMKEAGLDPAALGQNAVPPRQEPVAAPPAGFVPQFRAATIQDSFGHKWHVNSNYFADRETAQWIANKYGTGEVVEKDFVGSGGPFAADQREFHVRLATGRLVNAGILASYYDRNPESRLPGVADTLIRNVLDREAAEAVT